MGVTAFSSAVAPSAALSQPTYAPAPSQPIAIAARAFGDTYPQVRQRWMRAAGLFLAAATAFYLPWLLTSLNTSLPWLVWPFVVANVFTLASGLVSVFNGWWRSVPEQKLVPVGVEPMVGVIIPTCGEPVPMVLRTVISVFDQDWPDNRLVVVVSD